MTMAVAPSMSCWHPLSSTRNLFAAAGPSRSVVATCRSSESTRSTTTTTIVLSPSLQRRPELIPSQSSSVSLSYHKLHTAREWSPSASRPFSTATSSQPSVNPRSLLSLSGPDTYKLLQGLMTNDIKRIESQIESKQRTTSTTTTIDEPPPDAFYCAFLNPQGRLISTAFLYPHPSATPNEPHILVDCHAGNKETLLSFIKRFKLRSKVKVDEVPVSSDSSSSSSEEEESEKGWKVIPFLQCGWEQIRSVFPEGTLEEVQVFRDPRTPNMGHRILVPPSFPSTFLRPLPESQGYEYHRMTEGVPDGPVELVENQALPLEANLDLMNGVDFRKGCYVGQELTARTHYTGVVRKRIMPVRIWPSDRHTSDAGQREPVVGADIRAPPVASDGEDGDPPRSRRSKSAGKLLAWMPNRGGGGGGKEGQATYVGLASLRLGLVPVKPFAQGGWLTLQGSDGSEGDEWRVEAIWPSWWPQDVRAAIQGE